jgi:Putative amidoligase enzyme
MTMSEQQFECTDCGDREDDESGQELSNGDRVCLACYENYFRCDHCDEDAPRADRQRTESGGEICDRCQSRHYTYSNIQACYIPDDSTVTLRDSDEVVSETWAENYGFQTEDGDWYQDEENIPRSALHLYENNVLDWCKYDRHLVERGALLFGVELEMEPRNDADQSDLIRALGGITREKYILKEDGSLDDGVELVTIPLTLEDHASRFGWEHVLDPLRSIAKSGVDTDNCGMHVHINKAALSPLQIGKMLVFLNSTVLQDQITIVAQRDSNTFCKRGSKKFTDGRSLSEYRHDIVNVGTATVEIRMFRGNLRADRVFKNLEFCHALILYCRDASLTDIERWDQFAVWLLKRRSQYPHLVDFLAEKRVAGFRQARRIRKAHTGEVVTCA